MFLGSERHVRFGRTPFAVVDLETTGLYPQRRDRAIEIAIVRMRPDGSIEDEFDTLVNPERDVGPTDVHGIAASDVVHAPRFSEVAPDVAARLRGAILVGHNLRFDSAFLASEFGRTGVAFPVLPSLCTLRLAYRLLPNAPSRRLANCCREAGLTIEDQHHALGDARATAGLLAYFLRCASREAPPSLGDLGCAPLDFPDDGWVPRPPSGLRLRRAEAAHRAHQDRGYLAQLVERLPGDDATNADEAEYMALVDRVLLDRRVTPEEAHVLVETAQAWGLSRADVRSAHETYLMSLAAEAVSDGVVSASERRDLEAVAEMLGLSCRDVDAALSSRKLDVPRDSSRLGGRDMVGSLGQSLVGKSVCFTGTLASRMEGVPITRQLAEQMAAAAGLRVLAGVTKKLDILVVADANTSSSKAKKAREYGTIILAEAAFWRAIGAQVE